MRAFIYIYLSTDLPPPPILLLSLFLHFQLSPSRTLINTSLTVLHRTSRIFAFISYNHIQFFSISEISDFLLKVYTLPSFFFFKLFCYYCVKLLHKVKQKQNVYKYITRGKFNVLPISFNFAS